jgi:iron complex transport system ATP-binding protein
VNPLLTFSDVSFGFAARTIFSELNAGIHTGDCIALIGPNGVGKTTLLRLAAGVLRATSGHVEFGGRRLNSFQRKEIARSIALVPQQVEMPFPFTVEQFVEQGRTPYLRMFGGPSTADIDAVEKALELTDTGSLRSRIFNELSGGEQQRVKIALGLAQEPTLLLLDEPTQHLDIGRQIDTVELIHRLHRQGITILAAMHDLALIEGTFGSVWILSAGNGLREGSPRKMLQPEVLGRVFDCIVPAKLIGAELTESEKELMQ